MSADQEVAVDTTADVQHDEPPSPSPAATPRRRRDWLSIAIAIGAAFAGAWCFIAAPQATPYLGGLAVVTIVASFFKKGRTARRIRRATVGGLIGFALVPVFLVAYFFFAIGVMGAQIG
jgi:hypothetical protein